MTRLAAFAAFLLLATSAAAQHAPLVISNDTIGEMRMRQVASIVLPSGPPLYPTVVALHAFDASRPGRLYFGHQLGYDAAAASDSSQITRQFLDSHLRR
jgi:dienelactone hydrolase